MSEAAFRITLSTLDPANAIEVHILFHIKIARNKVRKI
jgi:hypothetical protein